MKIKSKKVRSHLKETTTETKSSTLLYPVIGFAGALLVSSTAFAQEVEMVVVTAQKRAQEIQDVPASISAFTGDTLQQRQIRTIDDLTKATPNISFTSTSSGILPVLSIRGVSADTTASNVDQPAALHIDGVYQPMVFSLNSVMSDLEAVEVLRGPQGTLYGRNANAGVINFITKKPTDAFEASTTVMGGSFGRIGARGYVSGPLSETVSARVFAVADRMNGYGRNLLNNKRVNGYKNFGVRAALRVRPSDDVLVDLSAAHYYSKSDTPSYLVTQFHQGGANYAALIARGDPRETFEPYKVYADTKSRQKSKSDMASATVTWDLAPNITLKSITGWQKTRYDGLVDYDATPSDYINVSFDGTHSRAFSEELNISMNLGERVELVGGLFYMDDRKYNGGTTVIFPHGVPFNAAAIPAAYVFPPGFQNHTRLSSQITKSKAAFADATVHLTEQLRVLGGIRYTVDDKTSVQVLGTQVPGGPITGAFSNFRLPKQKFDSVTGKVGAQYDVTPDVMAYVQWQNGYKDGGYNPPVAANAYLPESIKSWEVGVKSRLFNNRATLNVAAFDYKYKNMQINRVIPVPGVSASIMDNAPATIKGVEVELDAAFTEQLRGTLGVGYLDGKFGNFAAGNATPTSVPVIVNITGFQLPRAPKLTVNAALEYTMQIGDMGSLKSRVDYNYQSKTYYDPFMSVYAFAEARSLVNLVFVYTPEGERLSFTAYVRNLTDKAYVAGAFPSGTLRSSKGTWGDPRTFGAEITAKF